MKDFATYLKQERANSLRVLQAFVEQELAQFTGLGADFDTLLGHLDDYTHVGGKFGRPLLARLGFDIAEGDHSKGDVVLASISLELFHRFLLCHDDLIDGDLQRHGHPTLEKIYHDQIRPAVDPQTAQWWGHSIAMIAGDMLHSLALQAVTRSGFPSAIGTNTRQSLHACLYTTAAGWLLETKLKTLPLSQVTQVKVEQAMKLVSGEYSVAWPLRIGQVLAGKKKVEWLPELETYGLHIGLAFQIQDDILGLFGNPDQTGKPVGSDLREAKKSLLLVHAYQQASKQDKAKLETVLGKTVDEAAVEEIRQLLRQTGSLAFAQQQAEIHLDQALKALQQLPQTEAVDNLRQLAEFLSRRDH